MPFEPGKSGNEATQFQPGASGNPQGRPPKIFSEVVDELKAAGYGQAKAINVVEAFEVLVILPEDELKVIISDKQRPMLLRIAAKALLSPAKGMEIAEKMLDRAHGRPRQAHEVTGAGGGPIEHLYKLPGGFELKLNG